VTDGGDSGNDSSYAAHTAPSQDYIFLLLIFQNSTLFLRPLKFRRKLPNIIIMESHGILKEGEVLKIMKGVYKKGGSL
jgi:hypothetical protein